jgi:carbon-monoxide dehydrogenase large subunit
VSSPQVLVITPDVGGGFGAKISCYPEEALLGCRRQEGRPPLRWRETRSENMMAMGHGRAQVQYVTIGGSRDGKVTHYQLHFIQDAGGFAEMGTILAPFIRSADGQRGVRHPQHRVPHHQPWSPTRCSPPPYRGAGRPEATAAAERAMDLFGAEIGMDPAEARRINLIPKFLEPHTTAIGQTYDVGDYETALDKALAAAGYADLRAEQARRRAAGDVVQLGIGVSTYVEITGGVEPFGEHAKIEVLDNGRAIVYTGTSPHGQGHVTSWSMLAHEQTGIPMDQIDVIWGNTDLVPEGAGTMGSRSLQQGGTAVPGTRPSNWSTRPASWPPSCSRPTRPTSCSTRTVGRSTSRAPRRSPRAGPTSQWPRTPTRSCPRVCSTRCSSQGSGPRFPFGAHVAVVEVDTETGKVRWCARSPATTPARC